MNCEECKDCKYSFYEHFLECRRYPPVSIELNFDAAMEIIEKEKMRNSLYPHVDEADWCGEFKPKKINNLKKGDTE